MCSSINLNDTINYPTVDLAKSHKGTHSLRILSASRCSLSPRMALIFPLYSKTRTIAQPANFSRQLIPLFCRVREGSFPGAFSRSPSLLSAQTLSRFITSGKNSGKQLAASRSIRPSRVISFPRVVRGRQGGKLEQMTMPPLAVRPGTVSSQLAASFRWTMLRPLNRRCRECPVLWGGAAAGFGQLVEKRATFSSLCGKRILFLWFGKTKSAGKSKDYFSRVQFEGTRKISIFMFHKKKKKIVVKNFTTVGKICSFTS